MTLDSGTMILIAVVMGIYFISMIVISCMGRKYGKNFDDFISAGRNCTTLMIIGSAAGAHIGNGFVGRRCHLCGSICYYCCQLDYYNRHYFGQWRLGRSGRRGTVRYCSSGISGLRCGWNYSYFDYNRADFSVLPV